MITKELDGLEKCCIYANDFHLEMILLPYIKENLEGNKFIIFTENDLEGTVKTLLERTNLPYELKLNILNLGWDDDYMKKFDMINKFIKKEKITVIIKGGLDFIKKVANKINDFGDSNIEMIKCYCVDDINKENVDLSKCEVLNTRRI